MQSSSSFSDTRNGKNRPSNILSIRPQPSESLPWPSPSFVLSSGDGAAVSADPDRPSTLIRSSPTGRLPPTPLTATYKPTILPSDGKTSTTANTLKLPGIDDLLAHTPPGTVQESRTVPLPSVHDFNGDIIEDAPVRTGFSPDEIASSQSQIPASASKTGLFQGSASEWAGDNASFAQMERRPIAPRPTLNRRQSIPLSPESFRNMPSASQVQGLGLDLGEETPRLGSWSTMMTPTLASTQQQPGIPGAPTLSGSEGGRFLSITPSSPIKPLLRNWNTDLQFENRQYIARPFAPRSFSDGPTSIAMERERTVQIEGGLPLGQRTWGLALSTDEGRSFRRGDILHRQDGSVIGQASARQAQLTAPPTPNSASYNHASASTSKAITASPSITSSASKRSYHSTGLTPHIHKTRLTPTLGSSGKGKGSKSAQGDEVESPSLKMKSKQRSDQLREQAEFLASQGHLPTDLPTFISSSSPTSPTRDEDFAVVEQVHARTAPPSVSPRNKKILGVRNVDHNAQRMDSSPWGVFGINTNHDAWQPLGPPALSKVLGKLDLSDKASAAMEGHDKVKKARKGSASGSDALFAKVKSGASVQLRQYGSEDKENDVFGTSTSTMNKRTANAITTTKAPPSFGTRRIVNIR